MQIVKEKIAIDELKKMAEKMFGRLVKAVVDIEQEIMVVDAALHGDGESLLLEQGSKQDSLWGINILLSKPPSEDWIEFNSMLNIRPSVGNNSCSIENEQIRKKIITIVNRLVTQ
jgi:hypothetical protein